MALGPHPVLAAVSRGYSELPGRFPRVTHPSATDGGCPPPVRLACVRHAASVRSEPGSNSQVNRRTFKARQSTEPVSARHLGMASRRTGSRRPPKKHHATTRLSGHADEQTRDPLPRRRPRIPSSCDSLCQRACGVPINSFPPRRGRLYTTGIVRLSNPFAKFFRIAKKAGKPALPRARNFSALQPKRHPRMHRSSLADLIW